MSRSQGHYITRSQGYCITLQISYCPKSRLAPGFSILVPDPFYCLPISLQDTVLIKNELFLTTRNFFPTYRTFHTKAPAVLTQSESHRSLTKCPTQIVTSFIHEHSLSMIAFIQEWVGWSRGRVVPSCWKVELDVMRVLCPCNGKLHSS